MIQEERVQALNRQPDRAGDFVLYWMQAAQRARATTPWSSPCGRPTRGACRWWRTSGSRRATRPPTCATSPSCWRGWPRRAQALRERGIRLVVRREPPAAGVVELARRAALAVVDGGYLRHQRSWRQEAAGRLDVPAGPGGDRGGGAGRRGLAEGGIFRRHLPAEDPPRPAAFPRAADGRRSPEVLSRPGFRGVGFPGCRRRPWHALDVDRLRPRRRISAAGTGPRGSGWTCS